MWRAIEITTNVGCKNLCEYCPQDENIAGYKLRSRERVMSAKTFAACLRKIPRSVKIYFTGTSEPFLNPDCVDFVDLACRRGHETYVHTTLVGLTRAGIDRLAKMPVLKYVIHLPSSEFKENYSATPKYLELLRHFDAKIGRTNQVVYTSIGRVAPATRTVLGPDRPIDELRKEKISDRAGNVMLKVAEHRVWRGPIYCTAERIFRNILYPNGDVSICCEDYGLKHVIGNLRTDSYADLHLSQEFRRVLRGMADDTEEGVLCRRCEHAAPYIQPPLFDRAIASAKRSIKRALIEISDTRDLVLERVRPRL